MKIDQKKSLIALVFWWLFLLFIVQCGSSSYVECKDDDSNSQCVEQTPDEQSMLALNSGDYDTAQILLEALIAAEPEEYFRYPRLSSVYAGQAGFDVVNLGKNATQMGGDNSITDSLGQFVPSATKDTLDVYALQIQKMKSSVDMINQMPEIERKKGESFYGGGAELQLILYQAAYAIMNLNAISIKVQDSSGKLDPDLLDSLTNEEALVVLNSLKAAAATAAINNPAVGASINKVIDQLDSSNGDEKSKLVEFLKSSN